MTEDQEQLMRDQQRMLSINALHRTDKTDVRLVSCDICGAFPIPTRCAKGTQVWCYRCKVLLNGGQDNDSQF